MNEANNSGIAADLTREITGFVSSSPYNRQYYESPLVQFATADNPLFQQYKEIIGDFHMTPQELLARYAPEGAAKHGSVISIVLPIDETVRISNRLENRFGSMAWARTRYYGDEIFVDQLAEHVVTYLKQRGFWGMAPSRSPVFEKKKIGQDLTSNWSERHIAYAAGLGTFSINDGFITEKGIAIKLVSIVTDALLPQSERPYHHHMENCLWMEKGICGACMKRCPVGAITKEGHNKLKCYMHCYGEESQTLADSYGGKGIYGTGCGLCQTGVPCEYRNPNTTIRRNSL